MNDISEYYKCSKCGAKEVKLWRQYNSFKIDLFCVDCALEDQHVDYEVMENGKHEYSFYDDSDHAQTTDTIEWLVPAVPCIDDGIKGSYWGYTSVPQKLCEWWYNLPLRKENDNQK